MLARDIHETQSGSLSIHGDNLKWDSLHRPLSREQPEVLSPYDSDNPDSFAIAPR